MKQSPKQSAELWRNRFSDDGAHADCPKCERVRKFHKVRDRPAWDCDSCGYHLHPTAGTVFHKSSTSLHLWFYAMHLMTSTRCGISAKQLERELGVTYKTAWRIANLIRNELMADDGAILDGPVEADETYVGGRRRAAKGQRGGGRTHPSTSHKTPVFGIVQRGVGTGQVVAMVVPDATTPTLMGNLPQRVLPASLVYTDEWKPYENLPRPDTRIGASTTRPRCT